MTFGGSCCRKMRANFFQFSTRRVLASTCGQSESRTGVMPVTASASKAQPTSTTAAFVDVSHRGREFYGIFLPDGCPQMVCMVGGGVLWAPNSRPGGKTITESEFGSVVISQMTSGWNGFCSFLVITLGLRGGSLSVGEWSLPSPTAGGDVNKSPTSWWVFFLTKWVFVFRCKHRPASHDHWQSATEMLLRPKMSFFSSSVIVFC